MSNELALVLKTPIEELIPQMIAFNNEELLARVEHYLTQYEGITYDDSAIGVAKKDRTQLNAFCKALNDERIRIGKIYSEPYNKFKSEVDVVIDRVKAVTVKIDQQIKAYEADRQAKRQNEITEYFNSVVGDFAGLIPYEKIHRAEWLNVSTSMKSIKEDIDTVLTNAKNALVAIEALGSPDEHIIKAYYFRTLNLSGALLENERLKKERAAVAELKARQEAAQAVASAEQVVSQPVAPVKTEKPNVETSAMQTIRFAVTATIEQFKALHKFLVDNHIKYSKI